MKTIHKYPLDVRNSQTVMLPAGADVLCVQVQRGLPCLWALVPSNADPDSYAPVRFDTYGTGHPMPLEPGAYVGTYQLQGGGLVFHVFAPRA